MPTPYDAIIGLRDRETDAAAQAMRQTAERVAAIEEQIAKARANVAREAAFETEDLAARSDLYLDRMYNDIAQLNLVLGEAQSELDEQRVVLLQLVAETKALKQVAENYRAAQLQAEERAAQAQVDDRIGFLHGARAKGDEKGRVA